MQKTFISVFAIFLCVSMAISQRVINPQIVIKGKVLDEKGSPLIGATVQAKGTKIGTITDVNGTYSITVKPSNALIFSYTGYTSREITPNASNTVDVSMELNVVGLEDVVVVGYGQQSKRLKTQSISVIDEGISNIPVISPQDLIQGQAAGVQMTNSAGILGANSIIRIRGAASLNAGGNPLIVLDGIPLNDGKYSVELGSGYLNPLLDINTADIESISILKDASAAAIYGSRGSNGVILLTTKKGKANSNRINFDYYTGWVKPTNTIKVLSADQFRTFQEEYNNSKGYPTTSFDWPAAVLKTGIINNYNLSFSGGNDKTQYYLGGTFLRQSNYTIGNDLDKLNGRMNLKHSISDRFHIGANIGISRTLNDRVDADNSTYAPLTTSYLQYPYVTPYNANGGYANTGFLQNVLAIEALSIRQLQTHRQTGDAYASLDLIPEVLSLKSDWGIDQVGTDETFRYPDLLQVGGYGYRNVVSDNKWLTTNTLDFHKAFGQHNLSVIAGQSFETSLYESITVEGTGFASDLLRNVASAATPSVTSATRENWALTSQFLRSNYNFQNKYLFEASLRRDGSSRFGPNNKFGTFWAVAAGWILSDENFLKKFEFINHLKLTLSYGVSGNDRIGNYASKGLYQSGPLSDYAGLPGLRPTQAENPDLKWEQTAQLDLGIAVGILKNRVNLEFNYYRKSTKDILLNFQLPEVNGFSLITKNAGKMENNGVDLNIETVNFKTQDFEWRTKFNIGFVSNKVISLPDATKDENGNRFIAGSSYERAVEGYSANNFYLIRYKGINPETGNAEWLTKNDSVTTEPTPADRVLVGSAIPDFVGGITNSFRYKDFDFGFLFSFSCGNKVYLSELEFVLDPNDYTYNKSTDVLNYWKKPGDNAFAPGAASDTKSTFSQASTLNLMNGSFLRLRNISLGYTFLGSKLKQNWLERARVYVMGQNLLTVKSKTFLGADPEVSDYGAQLNLVQGESFFTAPQPKTITVGVNITFK